MRWHRGCADRRTGRAHCQLGPGPLSARSVCVCKWLLGLDVNGLLSGIGMWPLVRVVEGVLCTDGKCKVYLLSRCFRDVCLSWRCDMVSQGQSGDYREGICCWICCSSEASHPKMSKVMLESWLLEVRFPGLRAKSYLLLWIYIVMKLLMWPLGQKKLYIYIFFYLCLVVRGIDLVYEL